MKIILAPDSFKGSLKALDVAKTMNRAILDINKSYVVKIKPMADGGEGTLDAMLASTKGEVITVKCKGPLGEKSYTNYAILDSGEAIIELASIAGLVQVPDDKKDPDYTTTFGLGEVIKDALDKGCKSLVIGLGGSATNDGGLGMLISLGMKAWDHQGNELKGFGADLHRLSKIDFQNIDPRIWNVEIKVACDVDNPLCGHRGASTVFGPQKGASPIQVLQYDKAMEHYGNLVESKINRSIKNIPGVGAAGGVGFALLALGGQLVSGAKLLANTMHLEEAIRKADLVITGEGKSDEQTLYGKAPGHVASICKKHGIPVILLSGSLDGDLDKLRSRFSGCFSIINKPLTLTDCMEQVESLLYEQTKQILHLICNLNGIGD